ncbi:outer membrane protein assembly factor BamE [Candidatus Mesenet endosymbiont of Agriotes lineatus]|uniref:outer membrane protein assembly factor BamE n=1 Tax=Candidatus Mesenet endosymbiont of Agriotes lineatus TaxID=3077948 RepID=UPI0030CDD724
MILLFGFKPIIYEHGYSSLDMKLGDKIKLGDSKEAVVDLLGSPTFTLQYDDETWYYVSSKIKQYRFFQKRKCGSKSLQITFNNSNVVDYINYIVATEKEVIRVN